MSADSTTQLQGLLDRMAAGDLAARQELISRAYERLRRLARKMLKDFPRVRAFEDSVDVLHDSLPRLLRALDGVPPASVAEFFRRMSRALRWELLNLLRRYYGPEGPGGKQVALEVEESAANAASALAAPTTFTSPSELARWTEFHEAVEALPEKECQVFELLYYQELTQAEAARVLQVAEITVRRHWLAARRRLGAFFTADRED
jgi:RNA polymerase sigma-70 factor (ECF subfamily)